MYSQVVRQIDQYLDGSASKEAFETWLYDLAFDVEQSHTQRVISLVHKLEGTLSESSSGHWPEDVFKREIQQILHEERPRTIVIGQPVVSSWSSPLLQVRLTGAM